MRRHLPPRAGVQRVRKLIRFVEILALVIVQVVLQRELRKVL